MGVDRLKDPKRSRKENERLRRAVSDPTLDKLIPTEAAKDEGRLANRPVDGLALNAHPFQAPLVVVLASLASLVSAARSEYRNDALAACWDNIDPLGDAFHVAALPRTGRSPRLNDGSCVWPRPESIEATCGAMISFIADRTMEKPFGR